MGFLTPSALYALTLLTAFATGILIVLAVVPEEVEEEEIHGIRIRKRQQLKEESGAYKLALPMIKMFAHYFKQVPDGGNWFADQIEELREKLREDLPASGYMGGLTPNEFLGMCCVVGVVVMFVSLIITSMLLGTPRIFLSTGIGAISVGMPFMTLQSTISERLIEIDRKLPGTIDLILLSMRAGLDFMSALDRVVSRGLEQDPDDPMMQEMGVVLQEIRVGTPKTEALLNMCERVQSDYLDSMVGSIVQSEEKGTPLTEVLSIQVDTIRDKRTTRVEKAASSASVKLLFPLIFIMGSVMVLIFGMMGLKMYYGGM